VSTASTLSGATVLAYLEVHNGEVKKSSLEVLAEARRQAAALAGRVALVVLGPGAEQLAPSLRGAHKVFVSADNLHRNFHLEAQASLLSKAVRASEAQLVLLAATPVGREVAAALAGSLDSAVAADAVALRVSEGRVEVTRPVYAGKALLTVRFRRLPAVVTLRPNVFSAKGDGPDAAPGEQGSPEVVHLDAIDAARLKSRVVAVLDPPHRVADHTEASIIVTGGRGLKRQGDSDEQVRANFQVLESLARKLGGVVGASRAVCDAGWRPHSDQIGQTGKTVAPKLYIACGVSGAIQHLAGMSSSSCIVAVNQNADAPIFKVADYGIVGDLFEVVPAMERAL
jgi:electron transfer flavoprotein alpha subunit